MSDTTTDIRVRPLSNALGAEISGIDLRRPLGPETISTVKEAWNDHLVIVFRDQDLTQEDQERFCGYFGEMEVVKSSRSLDDDNPHILFVSNVQEEGKRTVLENGEMWFHSDQCYYECPVSATVLYAIEIPRVGGNTLFSNCYTAYETLPADLKSRIEGRTALHAYDYGPEMQVKLGPRSADAPQFAHPVVRTHPETGRRAIYVNRLMTEHIEDVDEAESDELLSRLFDHVERPEFIYEHIWRPGDLLMWDNRCTLHARTDFDPAERRMLRRMTVKGDRPY